MPLNEDQKQAMVLGLRVLHKAFGQWASVIADLDEGLTGAYNVLHKKYLASFDATEPVDKVVTTNCAVLFLSLSGDLSRLARKLETYSHGCNRLVGYPLDIGEVADVVQQLCEYNDKQLADASGEIDWDEED